ncbi:MAG TPA: hypothetical protein VI757_13645 [Bacteroidia bacterium]|nr:hypothetical protein [Bacteroidia bacterium]
MSTRELIKEIKQLPLRKRLMVIKRAMLSVKKSTDKGMEKAAAALLSDYKNDKELTAFNSIEFDNFYEAR